MCILFEFEPLHQLKNKKVKVEEDPAKKAAREAKEAASLAKAAGVDWTVRPERESSLLTTYWTESTLAVSKTFA